MRSFVYISASDVFPFIDPRYITTKREAERYLFQQDDKFKTVVLRPGKSIQDTTLQQCILNDCKHQASCTM